MTTAQVVILAVITSVFILTHIGKGKMPKPAIYVRFAMFGYLLLITAICISGMNKSKSNNPCPQLEKVEGTFYRIK